MYSYPKKSAMRTSRNTPVKRRARSRDSILDAHTPISRAKFLRKNVKLLLSRKISERKFKRCEKSVKGNKNREEENSRLFEHIAYSSIGILLFHHSVLSSTEKVMRK